MTDVVLYLSGKAKWARVYQEQIDKGFPKTEDPDEGKFSIVLYPDDASMLRLKESGSRVERKDDEEGSSFKFSRDNFKNFSGKKVILGPPKVVAADNVTIMADRIGNGSDVTIKVQIFDTKFGVGTRLEAVRVDNLIPFEPTTNVGGVEYPF